MGSLYIVFFSIGDCQHHMQVFPRLIHIMKYGRTLYVGLPMCGGPYRIYHFLQNCKMRKVMQIPKQKKIVTVTDFCKGMKVYLQILIAITLVTPRLDVDDLDTSID